MSTKGDFLGDRKQALEDAFFKKEEEQKLEAMREKLKEKTVREDLLKASGMTDDVVLDKLIELGLTGDTVVALSLCPLIHVAWADGTIQDNERDAILQAAKGKGIEDGDPAFELLSEWLGTKEPKTLWDAWSAYVGALEDEMSEEQYGLLRTQIVNFATAVAQAAGGFLGIKSVSKSEQEAIDQIGSAFGGTGS